MATKLALIDSDLLIRLLDKHVDKSTPPAHPILREMNTLDRQMHGMLHNPDLSDLAKSQNINSLLSKHDNFSRQFENQPPPTVTIQPQKNVEQHDQDYWYAKIVDSVPRMTKHTAKNLLDHIKTSKVLQWDREGKIVIDGETLADTNILDLIHGVTRQRKSQKPPRGAGKFLEALDKINTPKELVPNADWIRNENNENIFSTQLSPLSSASPHKRTKRKRKPTNSEQAPTVDYSRWQHAS